MEMGIQRCSRPTLAILAMASVATATCLTAYAGGFGGGLRGGAVGGVMVDSEGVVRTASVEEQQDYAARVRAVLDQPSGSLSESSDFRVVSLAGLQSAVVEARAAGAPVPDEASLLAGLQRIEFVFVDADENDILIAGPAEPWKLLEDGSIVGITSNRATLRLDDLAVAIRSVEQARRELISCSIEPTAEGRRRLNQMLSRVSLRPGQSPQPLIPAMKEAFGPQQVKLTGMQADSRMARTLVAADFEMKRLAMGLVDSPVPGLPSYLSMARNSAHSRSSNPRWWMACDYEDLARNADGTAWKIDGRGVKTLTDNDLIGKDGNTKAAASKDKTASKWASLMTDHYDELSAEMPVFADLRNAMDINLVATLIVQEQLAEKAGLDLTVLMQETDTLDLASYFVPSEIPPHCSFIQGAAGWVVTASGGVEINSFEVVERQQTNQSLESISKRASGKRTDLWWWNG